MTKKTLVTFALIGALGFATPNAWAQKNCSGQLVAENVDIAMSHGEARGCFMLIKHSMQFYMKSDSRTRSWQLSENGLMHFFVETSDKKRMSQSIGARSVHVLPFSPTMSSYTRPNGQGLISFTAPFGLRGEISQNSGNIESLEGFDISTGPLKHIDELIKENGGVVIKPKPGHVLIDYGFRMGEIPISQMWRTVTVSDGYGNQCKLKITNFMKLRQGDSFSADFLYLNSDEVKAVLAKRCPKIRW